MRTTDKKTGEDGERVVRDPKGAVVIVHCGLAPVGAEVRLTPGAMTPIGRESFAGVALDGCVSKRHFTIAFMPPDSFIVADAGSSNGTFVNGQVLLTSARVPDQTVVRFGNTVAVLVAGEAHDDDNEPAEISGTSPKIRAAKAQIRRAAALDVPALILGPTGTGKERTARAIHALSRRNRGPFISLSCASMTETLIEDELFGHVRGAFSGAQNDRVGLFEAANGGTLFLDEIGHAPPKFQVALLRVLQEGRVRRVGAHRDIPVDVRVVAATNADVANRRKFRRDVFERLARCVVRLPALSDRRSDILVLAREHWTSTWPGPFPSFSSEAVESLLLHKWTGNIRELARALDELESAAGEAGLHFAQWVSTYGV